MSIRFRLLIPFIVLAALLILLWQALFNSQPRVLPSAMVGENLPSFQLPTIAGKQQLSSKTFKGHVSLLTVWATWCEACRLEQPTLLAIQQRYHIPIYGIAYKSEAQDIRQWLRQNGNPFMIVANDVNGDAAIDLGIYGTPETFVISPAGKIVYRQVGAINAAVWNKVLLPIVRKYQYN